MKQDQGWEGYFKNVFPYNYWLTVNFYSVTYSKYHNIKVM